jgi:hypothetical protein
MEPLVLMVVGMTLVAIALVGETWPSRRRQRPLIASVRRDSAIHGPASRSDV